MSFFGLKFDTSSHFNPLTNVDEGISIKVECTVRWKPFFNVQLLLLCQDNFFAVYSLHTSMEYRRLIGCALLSIANCFNSTGNISNALVALLPLMELICPRQTCQKLPPPSKKSFFSRSEVSLPFIQVAAASRGCSLASYQVKCVLLFTHREPVQLIQTILLKVWTRFRRPCLELCGTSPSF